MSKFTNLFKKNDLDELQAFRKKVVGLLGIEYPSLHFEETNDPRTLKWGETTLGLTNLHSSFLLTTQTDADLRELVIEQFGRLLSNERIFDDTKTDWETAKAILLPQLMPAEYLEKMDLASLPFGESVVLGFVLDSPDTYSYVRFEDLKHWQVDVDDIKSLAIENLSEKSRGMEMTAFPGDNGIFVINSMDGFDAARIVDPELRRLIAEHLRVPYMFGIPNRDFLICWSENGDKDFQDNMSKQVLSDFGERPYPLSGRVFRVDENYDIALSVLGEPDPRASSSQNN